MTPSMPRYKLRTLLILLAVLPPVVAAVACVSWEAWQMLVWRREACLTTA